MAKVELNKNSVVIERLNNFKINYNSVLELFDIIFSKYKMCLMTDSLKYNLENDLKYFKHEIINFYNIPIQFHNEIGFTFELNAYDSNIHPLNNFSLLLVKGNRNEIDEYLNKKQTLLEIQCKFEKDLQESIYREQKEKEELEDKSKLPSYAIKLICGRNYSGRADGDFEIRTFNGEIYFIPITSCCDFDEV